MKKLDLSIMILAAGKGSRMCSQLPKALHKIFNKPMINYVIEVAEKISDDVRIIYSKEIEDYVQTNFQDLTLIEQQEQLGTGHAVSIGINHGNLKEVTLVLYADVPLITEDILRKLYNKFISDKNAAITVAALESTQDLEYGLLDLRNDGYIYSIIEADHDSRNCRNQLEKSYYNSGIMMLDSEVVKKFIKEIKNNNSRKEYYLTDLIKIVKEHNYLSSYLAFPKENLLGVNNKAEYLNIIKIKQKEINRRHMLAGVTLMDNDSIYIDETVSIGTNVVIYPNVQIYGNSEIHDNVILKSFTVINDSIIGSNATIGPFAHLREKVEIHDNVRIGSFVELKKSKIGNNVKVPHLAYIGDTKIGAYSNIGAGVITANYDGVNKFETNLGDNVFVGSNSVLIAPIDIASNSMIAAGSIINNNVEEGDLAIARTKQINLTGKAKHPKK